MTAVVGLLCCCDGGGPDECGECPPVTITWSGSCTWTGICCTYEVSGSFSTINRASYSLSLVNKTSPEFTNLCAATNKFTEYELPDIGAECGEDAWTVDPSTFVGARLRFRLEPPGEGGTHWFVRVTAVGDLPQLSPSEEAPTGGGWGLVFRAPVSGACPPGSGWEYLPDDSSEPTVGTVECGETPWDALVTSFNVGTVSVST